jgi:hypothetical protein
MQRWQMNLRVNSLARAYDKFVGSQNDLVEHRLTVNSLSTCGERLIVPSHTAFEIVLESH